MSYYILPKKHTNIEIDPSLDVLHSPLQSPPLKPIVSHSLISYFKIGHWAPHKALIFFAK